MKVYQRVAEYLQDRYQPVVIPQWRRLKHGTEVISGGRVGLVGGHSDEEIFVFIDDDIAEGMLCFLPEVRTRYGDPKSGELIVVRGLLSNPSKGDAPCIIVSSMERIE